MTKSLPIIDISELVKNGPSAQKAADAIGEACRDFGFFYIINHGVNATLENKLESLSRRFFELDPQTKMQIAMEKGGKAWRGYFPVGGELTSGEPDLKEGIYFGEELISTHPAVKAGIPLHGSNLFPSGIPDFRRTVLDYMDAMTELSHAVMRGVSLSLGLDANYFYDHFTKDPLILFRIFNYPHSTKATGWGVGEHTDYGVLTILKQDDSGGLEVKSKSDWIKAPPIPRSFICNIGDMLDRMTGGHYVSTPHRVKNTSGKARLSLPFFFDPNFYAKIQAIPIKNTHKSKNAGKERWDNVNIHEFDGTYSDYLLGKVSKVFPDLAKKELK